MEVVSLGHQLELVKQVGHPDDLERSFAVGAFRGSHAIGHTRLSTESRVDLTHSQPFWARGVADVATVHNGHITNYHRLRRIYEQRGVRFFSENDSEVIGVYIADQLDRGLTLEEALEASLDDFDGSFTYLVASGDAMGYARDPFALKPLITVETDDYVAVANEEIAIRAALGSAGRRPRAVRSRLPALAAIRAGRSGGGRVVTDVARTDGRVEIDATERPVREINREIRGALADGTSVTVRNPAARHSLGVALLTPGRGHLRRKRRLLLRRHERRRDHPGDGQCRLGPGRGDPVRARSSSTATPATARPRRSGAAPSSCAATVRRGPAWR